MIMNFERIIVPLVMFLLLPIHSHAQDGAEVKSIQLLMGNLELDGRLGPRTLAAIEEFSESHDLQGDFWSLYNWVERQTDQCLARIDNGDQLQEVERIVSNDFYDPEAERFRNITLSDLSSLILNTKLSSDLNDFAFDLDDFTKGEVDFASGELDFLNWDDEGIKNLITLRYQEVLNDQTAGICGEVDAKNIYGGFTDYNSFYLTTSGLYLENMDDQSLSDRFEYLTSCRITSSFQYCDSPLYLPENMATELAQIRLNMEQ
jgi:hypothetical protein